MSNGRECPQCGRIVEWRVCVTDAEAQGCAGWHLPMPKQQPKPKRADGVPVVRETKENDRG